MGFNDAVRELIGALLGGRYRASLRGDRNLLATGEMTADEVVAILRKCNRPDYEVSPLRGDEATDVHIFKPTVARERWYIKAYFIEDDEQVAIVISVHPSDFQ